jgi:hypothetical protein
MGGSPRAPACSQNAFACATDVHDPTTITVRLKPDTTDERTTRSEDLEKQILLISYSAVCIVGLLREDEPLLDAGSIAKKNCLRIDRDDRVAAGDRVPYANHINLPVAGEDCGAR